MHIPLLARRSVLTSLCVGVAELAFPGRTNAANPWDKKDPAQWSESDIFLLSTNSPWAKQVDPEIRMQPGEGREGANDAASQGRAARGNTAVLSSAASGAMGGAMGSAPQRSDSVVMATGPSRIPPVTVRWESAAPLLLARRTNLPKEMEGHYVVSVSGLQWNGDRTRRLTQDGIEDMELTIDRMRFATTLQIKGKAPLQAGLAIRPERSPAVLFGFSRELLQISSGDKSLVFTTYFGSAMVRAKFDVRDMMFHGRLSI